MSSEWFKDWFETQEYQSVYQHRNERDAEDLVTLILTNIILNHSAKVLDMACGTGRHSILFAKKGFNVTAVDLSKNMLSVARSKAQSENLNINFVQADLRYFAYTVKFELIVNLFTSFGYFESDIENFHILKSAYLHLNESGYFVLDFFNKHFIENNLVLESIDKIGSGEIIQRRKIEGQRIIKDILIKNNGHSKMFRESVRMYDPEELSSELTRIGFAIEKTFGDFHGSKFDKTYSKRIILFARK
jgi:ubiquinone/menaquinone biosynthesis C-methylase UbiE